MSCPVFGNRVAGQAYVVRPGAYALIRNDRGEFAVVATPNGLYLPGGGIEAGETPEQAIVREAREECQLVIRPLRRVAEAIQLVFAKAEDTYFEKPSHFVWAIIDAVSTVPAEVEHTLIWLMPESAAPRMTHESHLWAIREAARQAATLGADV